LKIDSDENVKNLLVRSIPALHHLKEREGDKQKEYPRYGLFSGKICYPNG